MNSKKLGVFAAAALTVLASQANAGEAKKGAKGAEVCANGCRANGHECAGYELKTEAKTKEACEKAKGKWMSKADVDKNIESLKAAGAAPAAAPAAKDPHKH